MTRRLVVIFLTDPVESGTGDVTDRALAVGKGLGGALLGGLCGGKPVRRHMSLRQGDGRRSCWTAGARVRIAQWVSRYDDASDE